MSDLFRSVNYVRVLTVEPYRCGLHCSPRPFQSVHYCRPVTDKYTRRPLHNNANSSDVIYMTRSECALRSRLIDY